MKDPVKDVTNFTSVLSKADQKLVISIFEGGAADPSGGAGSSAGSSKGLLVQKSADGSAIVVTGKTFDVKDELKSHGAFWDKDNKGWKYTGKNVDRICAFLNIDADSLQAGKTAVDVSEVAAAEKKEKKPAAAKTTGKRAAKEKEEEDEDEDAPPKKKPRKK